MTSYLRGRRGRVLVVASNHDDVILTRKARTREKRNLSLTWRDLIVHWYTVAVNFSFTVLIDDLKQFQTPTLTSLSQHKTSGNFFSFKKSRIVLKNVKRGTLLDLLTYIPLQNIKKTRRGDPLWTKKNSKKSRTVPKKLKGGPYSLVLFCIFSEPPPLTTKIFESKLP